MWWGVLCHMGGSTTCSTTCFVMLHYMAGNDYRVGRRQVSFVVDEGLWGVVRVCASVRGMSMTQWLTEVLERETGFGVDVVESEKMVMVEPGGELRSFRSGGMDWNEVLERGRAAKALALPLSLPPVVDPLEEIA